MEECENKKGKRKRNGKHSQIQNPDCKETQPKKQREQKQSSEKRVCGGDKFTQQIAPTELQQKGTLQPGVCGDNQAQKAETSGQGICGGSHPQQKERVQQSGWGNNKDQQRKSQWQGGNHAQRKQKSQQGGTKNQQEKAPQQDFQGGYHPHQKQSFQQSGGGNNQDQQRKSQKQKQGDGGGTQQTQSSEQSGNHPQQKQTSQQHSWGNNQDPRKPQEKQQGAGSSAWSGKQALQSGQSRPKSDIQQEMSALSIKEKCLPYKKASCNNIMRGSCGKQGIIEANYLRMILDNLPNVVYHYDVTIEPDRPKRFIRQVFEQCRRELFSDIIMAFDGRKNCYSLQRLPKTNCKKLKISDTNNRTKEFRIEIKETDNNVVELNSLRTYQKERIFDKPMRALQVLEVVLAAMNYDLGIRVGRSFYRRPSNPIDLGGGYEAWTGLYQTVILGEEPFFNVDVSQKSFPRESTVINYLQEQNIDLNKNIRNDRKYDEICKYLKGINIEYTPPRSFGAPTKQYKVLSLEGPACNLKFTTDDGKQLTVADYFRSRGYSLKYPNLNCLSVGSSIRKIFLPMEFCSIPLGQAINGKDGALQIKNMARYSTNERKAKIMELLRHFNHNSSDLTRAFGLRIDYNFIKIPMLQLPSPYIEYLQGKKVNIVNGVWRMGPEIKFLLTPNPPNGHKWAILFDEKCRLTLHDIKMFADSVVNISKILNVKLEYSGDNLMFRGSDLQSKLRTLAEKKNDLVFVILPKFGNNYPKIKQTAELEVGILTQCIVKDNFFRFMKDPTVSSNILLKVNGKLNGTNHKIADDKMLKDAIGATNNVMFIGADVSHPSPDNYSMPSVVGVVASHDKYGTQYNAQYRLQGPTIENIEDMESIVLKHLEEYHKHLKTYPSKIIYYRDGVSDGQFPIIKKIEITAIRNACKRKNCNPMLTCLVVIKRHHTRFFPLTKPKNAKDYNNVAPGTLVDQHITHPNEKEFFLVSHQSILGTARPTRYNVIVDDSNFDINVLHQLTYNMCHLFPRCNRSVSYPAPAYLAHLKAYRARVYLEGSRISKNFKDEYKRRQVKPQLMAKNPMYFI